MLLRKPCKFITIIGSRKISDYAARVGTRLAHILADKEFVIVGGLAVGSDTCGHRGAMEETGYTIAVMPCGLDMVVPSENAGLFLQMIDNGSLAISEYPIGHAPTKASYAERDRLQAGIADGLIVLETSEDGGTMHAVRKAAELHRITGISRSKLRRLKKNSFAVKPNGNKGKKSKKSVISGYAGTIDDYLRKNVTNSEVIFERLQGVGYPGSRTSIKRYYFPICINTDNSFVRSKLCTGDFVYYFK